MGMCVRGSLKSLPRTLPHVVQVPAGRSALRITGGSPSGEASLGAIRWCGHSSQADSSLGPQRSNVLTASASRRMGLTLVLRLPWGPRIIQVHAIDLARQAAEPGIDRKPIAARNFDG
jgi:hypothetical protein